MFNKKKTIYASPWLNKKIVAVPRCIYLKTNFRNLLKLYEISFCLFLTLRACLNIVAIKPLFIEYFSIFSENLCKCSYFVTLNRKKIRA